MSWVTFLCPSRGRPESLAKSIESLRATAYDPDCFEVLVYVDEDESSLYGGWGEGWDFAGGEHSQFGIDRVEGVCRQTAITVGPRLGYSRLHECIADLIPWASGTWLWLWNDDAIMDTPHWDLALRKHYVNRVLNPDTNHQSHASGLNVFPVVPKAWVDLVGWARNGANDTWWQLIGQMTGTQENLAVHVTHDRSDLTGGHDDATRAGNNYDPDTFWCEATQAEIKADALRIAGVFGR